MGNHCDSHVYYCLNVHAYWSFIGSVAGTVVKLLAVLLFAAFAMAAITRGRRRRG